MMTPNRQQRRASPKARLAEGQALRKSTRDTTDQRRHWEFSDCPTCALNELRTITAISDLVGFMADPCPCCLTSAIWTVAMTEEAILVPRIFQINYVFWPRVDAADAIQAMWPHDEEPPADDPRWAVLAKARQCHQMVWASHLQPITVN